MRVINQLGDINVPYENSVFTIDSIRSGEAYAIAARIGTEVYLMATYKSSELADKAMARLMKAGEQNCCKSQFLHSNELENSNV